MTTAAKALSLLTGGDAYYCEVLARLADPGPSDMAAIKRVVADYRGRIAAWRAALQGRTQLRSSDLVDLDGFWRGMGASLMSALSAPIRDRVAAVVAP